MDGPHGDLMLHQATPGAKWDELYTYPTKQFDTALWPVAFVTNAVIYAIAGAIAASVGAWLVIFGRREEKAKLSA